MLSDIEVSLALLLDIKPDDRYTLIRTGAPYATGFATIGTQRGDELHFARINQPLARRSPEPNPLKFVTAWYARKQDFAFLFDALNEPDAAMPKPRGDISCLVLGEP